MKLTRFLSPLLGLGMLLPFEFAQVSHAQFGRPVTIAVRKVKDRANAAWYRPAYEEKLADIMATELANSGNFTVVGRQDEDLAELQAEMNMQGINKNTAVKKNNLTQARYVVIATLSDFRESGSSGGGGGIGYGGFAIGGKKQVKEFYVAFDVKVYDTSTGSYSHSFGFS